MAVVHRIDLQDQIGVYTVCSQTNLGMSEVSKFRARSSDVASVHWVPGGTHLLTLDSPLSYKFCAYTPMGEVCTVRFCVFALLRSAGPPNRKCSLLFLPTLRSA